MAGIRKLAPFMWSKTRARGEVQKFLDQNAFRKLTLDTGG
jgi:hypothetical protein